MMAHKIKSNHYVATHRTSGVDSPSSNGGGGYVHRGYSTDGEESHRAASERTLSEYTTMNERGRSPAAPARRGRSESDRDRDRGDVPVHHSNSNGRKATATVAANGHQSPAADRDRDHRDGYRGSPHGDDASDVYVTSAAYKSPSELSRHSRGPRSVYSYRSAVAPSVASTHRSKVSRKAGVKVDAMAAQNPFCPSVKGMCCLMLLLNLGLILVTLGFVIVIQFFEPLFVWILGIVFLIFGFLTLIGSLVYCVVLCRDTPYQRGGHPEDLYWTHHWSKTIGPSEIHYRTSEKPYHNNHDDRYSDRYSMGKASGKYSDRESKLSRY